MEKEIRKKKDNSKKKSFDRENTKIEQGMLKEMKKKDKTKKESRKRRRS